MSPKKLLALSAVVVVLFAFIVFFERKMPTTEERRARATSTGTSRRTASSGSSSSRGAETLEFQRAGDAGWRMLTPEKYPADSFAVGSLVTELAEMKRAAGEDPSGRRRRRTTGSTSRSRRRRSSGTRRRTPRTKTRARSSSATRFPARTSSRPVSRAPRRSCSCRRRPRASVKKSAGRLQSHEVFGARRPTWRGSRSCAAAASSPSRRRTASGGWPSPCPDLADGRRSTASTGALAGLRVRRTSCAGPRISRPSGLSPPLFHVALTDAKGAMTAVDFGSTRSDGNSLYARRDGQVLTVDRDIVDELSKEAEAFRSRTLLGFRRGDVVGRRGRLPEGQLRPRAEGRRLDRRRQAAARGRRPTTS